MVIAAVRTAKPRSSRRELASATASVLSSRSFRVAGLALFCAESNNGCLTPMPRAGSSAFSPPAPCYVLSPLGNTSRPCNLAGVGGLLLEYSISWEDLAEIEAQLCDPQHWQNAPEHVERKCTAPRLPSAKGSHRDAQSSVWPARAHTLIGGGYRVAAFGASTGCLALVAPHCSFGGKLDASRTRPTVPSSLCLRGPGRVSAQLSADAKVASRGRLP
jgi:hypothetical protein